MLGAHAAHWMSGEAVTIDSVLGAHAAHCMSGEAVTILHFSFFSGPHNGRWCMEGQKRFALVISKICFSCSTVYASRNKLSIVNCHRLMPK